MPTPLTPPSDRQGDSKEQTISGYRFRLLEGDVSKTWNIPDTAFNKKDWWGTHTGEPTAYAVFKENSLLGVLVGRKGTDLLQQTFTSTGFISPDGNLIPLSKRLDLPLDREQNLLLTESAVGEIKLALATLEANMKQASVNALSCQMTPPPRQHHSSCTSLQR